MKQLLITIAVLALAGCSSPGPGRESRSFLEASRDCLEFALEHDGLVRVRPWERDLLARQDMSWQPDKLEALRRSHITFSKEASLGGGSAGGGGCGCN